MKSKVGEKPSQFPNIEGVYPVDQAARMVLVAIEQGIPVREIRKPGEEYEGIGRKYTVRENNRYIRIGTRRVDQCTQFWSGVHALESSTRE